MSSGSIQIRHARQNNLRGVDLEIPRQRLVGVTGVSGSGKSSLAFDTLYREGQRRFLETLSAYARQFLGRMEKPDVEGIDGLSPAIAVDQKSIGRGSRSTVGTLTEIVDHLRVLYARAGVAHALAGRAAPGPGVVWHGSGPLGPEVLAPLAERGRSVGKLHPLAALSASRDPGRRLRGAWFAVQGDPAAREAGRELVGAVGGRTLELSERPGQAECYHAAATLVAGGAVGLVAAALELLEGAAPRDEARAALASLLATAAANLDELEPAVALTGPVARGDAGVVSSHLAALERAPEATRRLYALLGAVGVDLTARGERLDAATRARLLALLDVERPPAG